MTSASFIGEMADLAAGTWRAAARTEYPLFAGLPVWRMEAPSPAPDHPGSLPAAAVGGGICLDLRDARHLANLLRELAAGPFARIYGGGPHREEDLAARLAHDLFVCRCFHQLLHLVHCPDGRTDRGRIDAALYQGLRAGLRGRGEIPRPALLRAVTRCRHAVWDLVADAALYLKVTDSTRLEGRLGQVIAASPGVPLRGAGYPGEAMLTLGAMAEGGEKADPAPSPAGPLLRAFRCLLFSPEPTRRELAFDQVAGMVGDRVGRPALRASLAEVLRGIAAAPEGRGVDPAGIDPSELDRVLDPPHPEGGEAPPDPGRRRIALAVARLLLDKRTRYRSLQGLVAPLASHLLEEGARGRGAGSTGPGPGSGAGHGGSGSAGTAARDAEEVLLALSGRLPPGEANTLLGQVANQGGAGGGVTGDQILVATAGDEYYKRTARELPIRSPGRQARRWSREPRARPVYRSTRILAAEEIPGLNLERIVRFHQETGIWQLIRVSDQSFRYDHYETEEAEEFDYAFDARGLELPDNLVFHVDSSGSMGRRDYVASGEKYDILMHVCYGILKTLRRAAEGMGRRIRVVAANFSNGTVVSIPSDLTAMYDDPRNGTKSVLRGFQGGGTVYSPDSFPKIAAHCAPGKTMHVWITDGELEVTCWQETLEAVSRTLRDPQLSFLYFEIGGASDFGREMERLSRANDHVACFLDTDLRAIQGNALELLIRYSGPAAAPVGGRGAGPW